MAPTTLNPTIIAGYNILQCLGFLATSCITLTAYFSRRIQRSRNWYLAMAMWTWWNIPYSLLMLSGHQLDVKKVPVPPRALCTIQAAFIYASPSSAAFANVGIIGHISSLLFETLYEKAGLSRKVSRSLFYLPLICYATIFFISLSVGIDNLSKVDRSASGAYCHIDVPVPFRVSAGACLIAAGLNLLLEVFTFALLWKHRAWVKRMRTSSSPVPISLFIRAVCFSIGSIIGSIISGRTISSNGTFENPVVVLITAAIPLLAAVTFGTQRDILRVWMFWKKPTYPPPSKEAASSV
ncbi:hypothetical protein DL96DRAFT_1677449 [Flagelloscypha sp. PMI_526]|nr:hypothetical protein DL96DRAFT_1677449 [Flagelloscypha sp. PMI_526]